MSIKKLLLEENVGGWDLAARAVVGTIAIIVLALGLVHSWWKWVLAFIAFGGLYTSITRHCTPYGLLGINTAKK
jgi:hypothetical protein